MEHAQFCDLPTNLQGDQKRPSCALYTLELAATTLPSAPVAGLTGISIRYNGLS
jgi:hypothetical protein